MAAGLINAALPGQKIVVISVLKNHRGLDNDIKELVTNNRSAWHVFHNYHCGGYAKFTPDLLSYMNELYRESGIPTDFVYTGKLSYAVSHLQKDHVFPTGSRVLLIHSGGLFGNQSLNKGTLIF